MPTLRDLPLLESSAETLSPGREMLATMAACLARLTSRIRLALSPCLRHEPLPERPLVVVAVALAFGCLAGQWAGDHVAGWPIACWAAAGAALIVWGVLTWRGCPRPAALAILAAVALAGAGWSAARSALFAGDDLAWRLSEVPAPLAIRGTLVESPRLIPPPAGDRSRASAMGPACGCTVRVSSVRVGSRWRKASGLASLIVAGEPPAAAAGGGLTAGAAVRILGRGLVPPRALNPGEFDTAARSRLARRLSLVRVAGWEHVRVTAPPARWSLVAGLDRLRARATAVLESRIAASRAPLAAALLLGQREALPREVTEEFVITGTIHVLAISGLHVGLLAAGLFSLFRGACLPRPWAALAVAALTGLYMLLVGAGTPVVRATILVWIACGAVLCCRRPATITSLAAAAIVLLVWRPAEVVTAGAQLSFLSTGILVGVATVLRRPPVLDPIDRLIERSRSPVEKAARAAGRWLGGAIVAAAAVWLVTAPLVAARFHVVSLVGLAINVLVAALVPVAMACGFLCLLAAGISSSLAGLAAGGCDLALAAIEGIVSRAAAVPGGHAWVAGPPSWWVAGWYALLAAALVWLRRDLLGRPATWAAVAAGWTVVGLVAAWALPPAGGPGLRVVMAAVGHGCGIVVRTPAGRCLLYDAGRLGAPAAARRSLEGLLWSERIKRIDTLVISHADADHCNAVPGLLARFRVGEIVVPESFLTIRAASVAAVREAARARGIPLRTARTGDSLPLEPLVRVRVVHAADAVPPPAAAIRGDNASSLVLAVETAGRRLLLTGDLEGPALRAFAAAGPGECDVLVAPHHGSATSLPADIARATRPHYVLVSGREGRSWPLVREAYAAAAGRHPEAMLLTGGEGAIAVTLTAGGVAVERFLAGRWRPTPEPLPEARPEDPDPERPFEGEVEPEAGPDFRLAQAGA